MKPSYIFSVCVFFLGLMLLIFSVPRLFSSLDLSHINSFIIEMQKDNSFAPTVVNDVEKKINNSISWHSGVENQYLKSIFLYQQLKIEAQKHSDIHTIINKTDHATKEALQLNPIDPFSWYQLAFIFYAQGQPDDVIINVLKYSIYTGPVEKDLLYGRILFMSDYISVMDDELTNLFKFQLLLLWQLKLHDSVTLIVKKPKLKSLFIDALSFSTEDQLQFNRRLKKAEKKNSEK